MSPLIEQNGGNEDLQHTSWPTSNNQSDHCLILEAARRRCHFCPAANEVEIVLH